MGDYIEVPWSAAEKIANEFQKDQVIIVTWDEDHEMVHVTTFGRTMKSSAQAAEGGNFVKRALGWPDRLCHDVPDWYGNLREALSLIANFEDYEEMDESAAKMGLTREEYLELAYDNVLIIAKNAIANNQKPGE